METIPNEPVFNYENLPHVVLFNEWIIQRQINYFKNSEGEDNPNDVECDEWCE